MSNYDQKKYHDLINQLSIKETIKWNEFFKNNKSEDNKDDNPEFTTIQKNMLIENYINKRNSLLKTFNYFIIGILFILLLYKFNCFFKLSDDDIINKINGFCFFIMLTVIFFTIKYIVKLLFSNFLFSLEMFYFFKKDYEYFSVIIDEKIIEK